MARSISMRAVGVVADIVLDWAVPAGDDVARAAVGKRPAEVCAMRAARGRRAARRLRSPA